MTASPQAGGIDVIEVADKAALERFVRLPSRLHEGDPHWIPPLLMERRQALSPGSNPFFRHAEVALWLAMRDGCPVGRISTQVDARTATLGTGHFGLIAGEDDAAVFAALTATAEGWLAERGMHRVQGPFSLSINEEAGLLVDGFDSPPMLMMPHDRPYVGRRLEEQGYAKAKDLLAYLNEKGDHDLLTPSLRSMVDRPLPKGVVLRQLDMRRYDEEIRTITAIFNDAWAGNWGFVPLEEAETRHLAKSLRPLVDRRLVWFADIDGEPAGFGVCLPNLNEAIRDLDGRLAPFGWAKLLWRLKIGGLRTCRVPLMGVRRKFAGGMRGRLLPFLIIAALYREGLKLGFEAVELSWILEDNLPMRHINEALGGRAYKTYRIYEKALR